MNRNMKAITWGLEVRGLDPGPWRLLMVLCSFVGKRDFKVWPSYATMAEKAEISRPSAKRFVQILLDRGLIEQLDPLWRENGGRSVNVYRIRVDEIAVVEEDDDEEDDYLPASDPRVNLNRGQGHSSDPGARFTAEPCREPLKEGTSIPEDSPLSLTGEAPPEENGLSLFGAGELTDRPSIVEYVKAGWAKLCDDFPRTHRVTAWNDARVRGIVNRAREWVKAQGGAVDAYETWDLMFAAIRADPWLRGEGEPSPKYPTPFALDIDYILRAPVFPRTLEKARNNDRDIAATSNPANGRRFGPAEQAARDALRRRQQARAGGE